MEQRDGSSAPVGTILAVAGGVLLAIGSVLTWAKVSLDLDAFADALGVDPAQLGAIPDTSKSFAGTSAFEGKVALVCGLVAIVVGVVAYAKRERWMNLGVVAVIAGLVGSGVALYDVSQKNDILTDALADASSGIGPALASIGLDTSILGDIFKVTLGIGIWICVIGGIGALLGGLWLITKRSATSVPAMAGMPSDAMAPVPDSGFGTSSVAGSMAASPTPAPTTATEMPSDAMDAPSGETGEPDAPSP